MAQIDQTNFKARTASEILSLIYDEELNAIRVISLSTSTSSSTTTTTTTTTSTTTSTTTTTT